MKLNDVTSQEVLKMTFESLKNYTTEELLEELEARDFKVAIKVLGVNVSCMIGNKAYEVTAQ